jgi:hypothetical protein
MKTLFSPRVFLAALTLLMAAPVVQARPVYGVSGYRGGAVVGHDRAVVATRRGFVATGPNATVVGRRPIAPVRVVAPIRGAYIRTIPAGYSRMYYGGYNCFFVGGIYYRPVIYEGATVYVVVD